LLRVYTISTLPPSSSLQCVHHPTSSSDLFIPRLFQTCGVATGVTNLTPTS
jgi:hypothetical protein